MPGGPQIPGGARNDSDRECAIMMGMVTAGPTTTRYTERFAGNLLRLARARTGLSQRDLAARSGVSQSVIAAIESGARQPSWPLLCRILAGGDLEPRVQLAPYDDHDDVLDRRATNCPDAHRAAEHARDRALAVLTER